MGCVGVHAAQGDMARRMWVRRHGEMLRLSRLDLAGGQLFGGRVGSRCGGFTKAAREVRC
jgi:hypothetical protein